MTEVERRLMPLVENGEITRLLVRAPRAFGNYEIFNNGIAINVLSPWGQRRSAWDIMAECKETLGGPARRTRLPGDAPGLRRPYPEAGAVRHRRGDL
jgi:hypothetical protein